MLDMLAENINRWRKSGISEYHEHVFYMGSALNRVGDHELCLRDEILFHKWQGAWREIRKGSDFWLLSVSGTFAWARDLLKEVHEGSLDPLALAIDYDEELGFIRQMKINLGRRNLDNFNFEVREFETYCPPDLDE